jgi:transcriptional antiterminator NusG
MSFSESNPLEDDSSAAGDAAHKPNTVDATAADVIAKAGDPHAEVESTGDAGRFSQTDPHSGEVAGDAASDDAAGDDAASDEAAGDDASSDDDGPEPVEPPYVERPPVELAAPEPEVERNWYILKVQSNREESIRDGLVRRLKIAGLDEYFGDIIVPTETVTEFKNGKKKVVKRKLYPGYIVVNMAITDDTWFVVRETPGIGDFTGAAGKPSPMRKDEIEKLTTKEKAAETEAPTLSIAFRPSDRVKINDGTFENFEGEVSAVDSTNGRITVMINIFGRSTPVELEYWQVEAV